MGHTPNFPSREEGSHPNDFTDIQIYSSFGFVAAMCIAASSVLFCSSLNKSSHIKNL